MLLLFQKHYSVPCTGLLDFSGRFSLSRLPHVNTIIGALPTCRQGRVLLLSFMSHMLYAQSLHYSSVLHHFQIPILVPFSKRFWLLVHAIFHLYHHHHHHHHHQFEHKDVQRRYKIS
ncbi:uncharacterized protein BO95DRAFT_293581 [Aspergillus brunneoviolaceus CBS 621.78]|uniref:Uncharacterized protein n=1 Tax=Aspergillus brunneoviolaceus CBS 621.78 TaxID=1450534 RepID=A0ACD1FUL6_9EURO|nr:hypothetical protein BO95DRAFT_293581 [Aspergillus brunneoviolaceus CBS 621.78]RAH40672.1 hypothetical protein BO95DRAFT_293581 [Aspergillus brunneoviolaceus CBS 621.78]